MTTRITVKVNTPEGQQPIRNIKVFNRELTNLGTLVYEGVTDINGDLNIDLPPGEYFVLKESIIETENSQVFDYVTPYEVI
jgi:hypothetical protein